MPDLKTTIISHGESQHRDRMCELRTSDASAQIILIIGSVSVAARCRTLITDVQRGLLWSLCEEEAES